MAKKTGKSDGNTMTRGDFIAFLSSATPEEINKVILERGKPRKIIDPLIYYEKKDKKQGGK